MYHQFKQLADIDITTDADGGRAHHALHHGRHPGRWRQPDVHAARSVRGGRVRGGPARREPAGRQLALRPAGVREAGGRVRRAVRPGVRRRGRSIQAEVDDAVRHALEPFERGATANGEGPVPGAAGAAGDDAGPGRHRAHRAARWSARSRGSGGSRSGRAQVGVPGNREYNPGWHTALDLGNLLTVSEAVTRAAIERQESRGGHFREDCPDKDPAYGEVQHRGPEGRGRRDAARAGADSGDAGGAQAGDRGAEVATGSPRSEGQEARAVTEHTLNAAIWSRPARSRRQQPPAPAAGARTARRPSASGAATGTGGRLVDYTTAVSRGWSCSTRSTRSRPSRPTTWPSAGTARPASAARAPPK